MMLKGKAKAHFKQWYISYFNNAPVDNGEKWFQFDVAKALEYDLFIELHILYQVGFIQKFFDSKGIYADVMVNSTHDAFNWTVEHQGGIPGALHEKTREDAWRASFKEACRVYNKSKAWWALRNSTKPIAEGKG